MALYILILHFQKSTHGLLKKKKATSFVHTNCSLQIINDYEHQTVEK